MSEILEIFDYWVQVMNKNTKLCKLTPKRKKAIKSRLDEGYDIDIIKMAIDGCRADKWSMGQNSRNKAFNDIELICRTGEKVEYFAEGVIDNTMTAEELNGQSCFDMPNNVIRIGVNHG